MRRVKRNRINRNAHAGFRKHVASPGHDATSHGDRSRRLHGATRPDSCMAVPRCVHRIAIPKKSCMARGCSRHRPLPKPPALGRGLFGCLVTKGLGTRLRLSAAANPTIPGPWPGAWGLGDGSRSSQPNHPRPKGRGLGRRRVGNLSPTGHLTVHLLWHCRAFRVCS